MPARRDEATLELAARDVCYEVNALFRAYALYDQLEDTGAKGLIFEALLVHFRNLLDFFFKQGGDPDDIRASDFFPDRDHWKPTAPAWVEQCQRRCNKLLAHLTYSRIEYGNKGEMTWQLDDQLADLRETWARFLAALPDARAAWFR